MKPQQLYSIAPLSIQLAQQEQKHWANYNFPKSTQLHVPALGVAEEVGEAYAALASYVGYEEWRDIPDFVGLYQVSSLGRIKRVKGGQGAVPGRILKGRINRDGYCVVNLYSGTVDSKVFYSVHQLVALAFIVQPPNAYYEVNHKDGNKLHNYPYNLEYVLHQDNIRYAISLSHPWGFETNLLPEQIAEIRLLLRQGIPNVVIAKHFGVDQSTISGIKTGRHYYTEITPTEGVKSGVVAAGELCHAVLKMEQGIRGDQMPALVDAIGDICIYLIDLCNKIGVDFETCILNTWAEVRDRDWITYPVNGKTE